MPFESLLNWVIPGLSRHRTRPATRRLAVEVLEDRAVPADLTVVMSGLDNPRGLAFGPEGGLYVAEAGRGGDGPSFELRPGVIAKYGPTGAVSRLWHGEQARVATGLPSHISSAGTIGPHDISFQGRGNAYVTVGFQTDPTRRSELGEAGAGFAQLVRLTPNGNSRNVFDIGANEATANPGGGPLDSNPYGLLAEPGGQVVTDAGGNALLRIAANGKVSKLAEFPSRDDGRTTDAVPTCVAVGPDGAYYVGELTGVPFAAGAARVYRVVPGQAPQVVHAGFKTIIDIDFGPDGSLYVLQIATGAFLSGSGALIRVAPDGTRTTVASEGLVSPTSVLVGDDGTIYVSNRGTSVGIGEVVRVTPTPPAVAPARAPGSLAGSDWALSVPSGQGALPGAKADSRLTDAGPPPRHEATGPDRSAVAEATGDRAAAPAGSPSLHANRPESGLADWPGAWPGDDDIFNPIVV